MLTPLNPQQTLYVHLLLLQLPVVPLIHINGGLCHWDTEMAVATGPPT